ncbi:hypothetical protein MHH93_27985, partial [Priestia sp. FSL H7-0729]
AGVAGANGATAWLAGHRRVGSDPRACCRADVAGCPEEDGQPGNQMIHPSERGRSQITSACLYCSMLHDSIHFICAGMLL